MNEKANLEGGRHLSRNELHDGARQIGDLLPRGGDDDGAGRRRLGVAGCVYGG